MTWRTIIANLSFGPNVTKSKSKRRSPLQRLSNGVSYLAVFAMVASVITVGYQSPVEDQVSSASGNSPSLLKIENPSLDQLVAADLAASAAEVADLSIATNASNLSVSLNAKKELSQSSDTVLVKPQIIQGDDSQRGITEYKVVRGDTVQSVAKKFDITTQTLKWANDLTSDALNPGARLLIPSTDGVIHKIKDGDSTAKLAKKYKTSEQRIVTYNDLEVSGLSDGKRIVIPGGVLPSNERPRANSIPSAPAQRSSPSLASGYGSASSASVGNRYAIGNCTWYVYERRAELGAPVGSFWGNAATWASFARSSGYRVDNVPAVGAILQDSYSAGGYGHVAVVESVNGDGSVTLSEMNYAGWNVISSRTMSAGQAKGYTFIH